MYGVYCRLGVSVGASALAVIRAARRKIARHHRNGREKRMERHIFYRAILKEHDGARARYRNVTGG